MIVNDIKIFSQNVWKNNLIVNTILEVKANFNIIFIQEPSWSTIQSIPSSSNCKGEFLVGVINHSNWLTFARTSETENDYLRVVIYVNIRLSSLCFSLHKDIINHRVIILVSFFNNNDIFWLMNVYSDFLYSALKYLKDTEVCIWNLLIMTGNFNICDNLWDLSFPHHSSISDDLLIIADSFNLELSNSTNQVPTRYSDNKHDSNSVIDLMFLCSGSSELDNHLIHPNWHLTLDYAPLTITIPIDEKNINSTKCSIIKDSDEKTSFIKDIITSIRNINISNLLDVSSLDRVINKFTNGVENAWEKNAKVINITKYSKSWWNTNCNRDLKRYRSSKSLED